MTKLSLLLSILDDTSLSEIHRHIRGEFDKDLEDNMPEAINLSDYKYIILATLSGMSTKEFNDKKDLLKKNKFWWYPANKEWGKPYKTEDEEKELIKLLEDNNIPYTIMSVEEFDPSIVAKRDAVQKDIEAKANAQYRITVFDLADDRFSHNKEDDSLSCMSSDLGWKPGWWPTSITLKDGQVPDMYTLGRKETDAEGDLLYVEYINRDKNKLIIYND